MTISKSQTTNWPEWFRHMKDVWPQFVNRHDITGGDECQFWEGMYHAFKERYSAEMVAAIKGDINER